MLKVVALVQELIDKSISEEKKMGNFDEVSGDFEPLVQSVIKDISSKPSKKQVSSLLTFMFEVVARFK